MGGEAPTMNQNQPFDVDLERQRAAATRSYVTPAVITLILYFLLWVPGLVANIVYYIQSSNDQALVGRAPDGKGCLTALLVVFVGLPVAVIGIFVVIALVGGIAASVGH